MAAPFWRHDVNNEPKGRGHGERPIVERLFGRCRMDPVTGCWIWMRSKDTKGYGRITKTLGEEHKTYRAHRIAWEEYYGLVPEGMCVLHQCDTPACCRPDHLFLGTLQDNSSDMVAKGRSARGPKHRAAKLTENDVLNIRKSTEPQKILAERYGVDQSAISHIKSGRVWKHI